MPRVVRAGLACLALVLSCLAVQTVHVRPAQAFFGPESAGLWRGVAKMWQRGEEIDERWAAVFEAYEDVTEGYERGVLRSSLVMLTLTHDQVVETRDKVNASLVRDDPPFADEETLARMAQWRAKTGAALPDVIDLAELEIFIIDAMTKVDGADEKRRVFEMIQKWAENLGEDLRDKREELKALADQADELRQDLVASSKKNFRYNDDIGPMKASLEKRIEQLHVVLKVPSLDESVRADILERNAEAERAIEELEHAETVVDDVIMGRTPSFRSEPVDDLHDAQQMITATMSWTLSSASKVLADANETLKEARPAVSYGEYHQEKHIHILLHARLKRLDETIPKEIEATERRIRTLQRNIRMSAGSRIPALQLRSTANVRRRQSGRPESQTEKDADKRFEEWASIEGDLYDQLAAARARLEALKKLRWRTSPASTELDVEDQLIANARKYDSLSEKIDALGLGWDDELGRFDDDWVRRVDASFKLDRDASWSDRRPLVSSASLVIGIDENTVRDRAGLLVASDPDGDRMNFKFVGDAASSFAIDASTGWISVVEPFDFEETTQLDLRVRISQDNGFSHDVPLRVNVFDLDEGPQNPIGLSLDLPEEVEEHQYEGYFLGSMSADRTEGVTFRTEGEDADMVKVEPIEGLVRIPFGQDLDHELDDSLDFSVVAEDGNGVVETQEVSIPVTDMTFDLSDLGDWDDVPPAEWKAPHVERFFGLQGPAGEETMWYDTVASGKGPDVGGTYRGEVIHRFTRSASGASEGGFGSVDLGVSVNQGGGGGRINGGITLRDAAGLHLHPDDPINVDTDYFESGAFFSQKDKLYIEGTFAGENAEEIAGGFNATGEEGADFHKSAGVFRAKRR